MAKDEAIAILERPRDQAVDLILALAEKAEKYDQICGEVTPTIPSGMTPVYLKPSRGKRKKRLGSMIASEKGFMTGLTKYCKYITKTKTPKGSSRD